MQSVTLPRASGLEIAGEGAEITLQGCTGVLRIPLRNPLDHLLDCEGVISCLRKLGGIWAFSPRALPRSMNLAPGVQ